MAGTQEPAVDVISVPETVQNYVGGEWIDSDSGSEQSVVDPATGETLASMRFTSASDVDAVVGVADDAFEDWRAMPAVERSQYLFDLKEELEARSEEIARALSREHGKTVGEARGEVRRVLKTWR